MVSLPHGAASAQKDIKKQIPLLQGYEKVVLFFDNDDAGRRATELAAQVLPTGKVFIARMDNIRMRQKHSKTMMPIRLGVLSGICLLYTSDAADE